MSSKRILSLAYRILSIESAAILQVRDQLDDGFLHAVDILLRSTGKVVTTGMGKSGLVARKLAATLCSTGTPATFLHPADALHGDFGILQDGDTLIVVSNSGETDELLRLLPAVRTMPVHVIALVGDPASAVARCSDAVVNVSVWKEAFDLVATASTTAALAMADALACILYEEKGLSAAHLSRLHPAGALGQQIQLSVGKIDRNGAD